MRHLSSAVPDLPRARRGDGLAARPHLPDARGRRGPGRADRDVPAPHRSLSRLPGVRDGVPVGCQIRVTPRSHACPAAAKRTAGEASAPGSVRVRGLPGARAARRRPRGVQALQALGRSRARSRERPTAQVAGARRDGGAARRRPRGDADARDGSGARALGRARRAPHGLCSAPSLPEREPRHRPVALARRFRRRDPARAGLLWRPRAPCRPGRCV